MTRFETILEQALTLDERERELLVIEVSQSLGAPEAGGWDNPELIAELERRVLHARQNPETVMEWDEAEKAIFGDNQYP